jgi:hypothetical protein
VPPEQQALLEVLRPQAPQVLQVQLHRYRAMVVFSVAYLTA